MSVVAADGIHVACDGQVTAGHSEISRLDEVKVCEVEDGALGRAILGFVGAAALCEPLKHWYRHGANPRELPAVPSDINWTLFVITKDGPFAYSSRVPYPERLKYPLAYGCGSDYATGAMHAGASAKCAVEITIALDAFCGGKVTEINIAEALGQVVPLKVEAA